MKQRLSLLLLNYIRILAKIQLWKINPDIIGITGSAGKSSVRNAVARILETKYKCKVTGKANSESGIPLDILGLEMKSYSMIDWLRISILAPIKLITNWKKYDKYIVEMGIDSPDEPKNMGYLLKILQPTIGVFINAMAVHSEPFDKLVKADNPKERKEQIIKLIAQEKGRIIESLPGDGFAILNFDDENVRRFAERTRADVYAVCKGHSLPAPARPVGGSKTGSASPTMVCYENVKYNLNGFACDLLLFENDNEIAKQHLEFRKQIFGPQYAITFALAIAVGLAYNIAFDDCVDALRLYRLPPGRMSLLPGINNSHIIDSSYNASAETMLNALDVLNYAKGEAKKIAVLGDMRELGKEAKHEHERVAEKAVEIANELILVGPLMKEFFIPKAEASGFDKEKIHWFENSVQAADFVKRMIADGEVILVKGSQNTIFLERVVEAIMANPGMADELLCRRGKYWERTRQN